ncbi:RCC1 domain-containing protein [Pseudomonas japonica]|uniref:Alpha-tubulin suppressor n=1 Tax=Pseudomonas japonica TaxID=256466 RepID=A0A239G432_9PSED|nr:hypothetical protein [Pseudomonas japonica]SNS63193.1 Alpha-tubulin suppressor [Pseudomonas japonica]
MTTDENAPLNLDPILIPGLIVPVQTEGADGGVNYHLLHVNEGGLLVEVQAYLNMQANDWIEVFWGDESSPVAGGLVLPEHVGNRFGLLILPDRIAEGISDVWARVTRSGGGNGGESPPLAVLVRSVFPGGTDPEPDLPGHQNLPAPEPELPPGGIIDEEAAKNGIKVTIARYPNMREFDRITFSWGGELLQHDVTQAEVDAGSLEILVTEDTILAAGDSDNLVLVYRVRDEVHNVSSDWSLRTVIEVEVGQGLFNAPMIENPDPDADPYDVIDLDLLGDDDLIVSVYADPDGKLQIDDVVRLTWVGTTAQGETITVEPPEKTVTRIPINLEFPIPNADVRALGRGRAVASHRVTRDGSDAGASKRTFATFLGEEQRLPKPTVPDAVNGVLDPTLDETTAIVPGDALEAGDTVILTWFGIRANGTPLVESIRRPISGGGAGKPLSITIDGASLIAPLDGGTLSVYYRLIKASGIELDSDREQLDVGEARAELPAPFTRPAAEDGILDPETLPGQLEIVIPPWPGMAGGQTLYVIWNASSGPHFDDFIPISPPMVGQEVVFVLDRAHVEANLGADIVLSYQVERPGEPTQVSEAARFGIGRQEQIESGPVRIMGARWNVGTWTGAGKPRMISALHDDTLQPMLVGWRYEDSEDWTAATTWLDEKPWLKLYVRSTSETWECRPANIVGNGIQLNDLGKSAFVAMRDEVMGEQGIEVDMVAWGVDDYGGKLTPALQAVDNVAEIAAGSGAFAARLRDGNIVCWKLEGYGGTPGTVYGDYVQLRSAGSGFAGLKADGEIFSWGPTGTPVPDRVLAHRDYIEICAGGGGFVARRKSGHAVAWGTDHGGGQMLPGQDQFDDIVRVVGNGGAFAALRDNGSSRSVIAWGTPATGGMLPEDIARLTNVKDIAVANNEFCVLLDTGELKVWPDTSPANNPPHLQGIVEISGSHHAFCARLDTGRIVAWGSGLHGGSMTNEAKEATNVVQVTGNLMAFAALRSDGTVVAWGNSNCGGSTASVAGQLVNVRAIYGNLSGFTALTRDGRVVTWGVAGGGGNSDHVRHELTNKVTHSRLLPMAEAEAVLHRGTPGK